MDFSPCGPHVRVSPKSSQQPLLRNASIRKTIYVLTEERTCDQFVTTRISAKNVCHVPDSPGSDTGLSKRELLLRDASQAR